MVEFASGKLHIQDQVHEYMDRSEHLSDLSYFDFFSNTYDVRISAEEAEDGAVHKRGRHLSFPYLPDTGHDSHRRILRREDHETMVTFSGRWFPRANDPMHHSLYCASVLALMKPWRQITDIKNPDESFEDAMNLFLTNTTTSVRRVLDNIQYYYDCLDKALENRETTTFHDESGRHSESRDPHEMEDIDDEVNNWSEEQADEEISIDRRSAREVLYTDIAMNIATEFKIFDETLLQRDVSHFAHCAIDHDLLKYEDWMHAIQSSEQSIGGSYDSEYADDQGEVVVGDGSSRPSGSAEEVLYRDPLCTSEMGDIERSLNEEQAMAFTILQNYIYGITPTAAEEPLLMIVTGPGGTGKTRILQALAADLQRTGQCELYLV